MIFMAWLGAPAALASFLWTEFWEQVSKLLRALSREKFTALLLEP